MVKDSKNKSNLINTVAVGCQFNFVNKQEIISELDELKLLSQTAGYDIKKIFIQKRNKVDPATFIGKGKIDEIILYSNINNIKLVIFNDDLSPTQIKNIQKHFGEKKQLIDRSGLIIEIFSKNARTKESKVQVEIAKLEYMLPRLTRLWTHLERQMGGRGTRGGPGETQIEVDRRLISTQLVKLKSKLKKIESQRLTQNKSRNSIFKVCLCGYTNAGKSTLMKLLSGSKVYVQDELFATLDATSRKIFINNSNILLTDTVGFINKLPHNLIASFRSTLSVVKEADLIIKVLDSSSNNINTHHKVINDTLKYLEADQKDQIIVYNKIDLINDEEKLADLKFNYPDSIFISARQQSKIKNLINQINKFCTKHYIEEEIEVNYSNTKILNYIYKNVEVINQINNNDKMILHVKGSKEDIDRIKSKINY